MKKIFTLVITFIMFFSLCSCKEKKDTTEVETTETLESSDLTYDDVKITPLSSENAPWEEIFNKIDCTEEQKAKIYSLVNSLWEAEVLYNFSSPKEIFPRDWKIFLAQRYLAYYDYNQLVVDQYMSAHLSDKVIRTIFKEDFGIDEIPINSKKKDGISIYVPFGTNARGSSDYKLDKVSKEDNTIKFTRTYYYVLNEYYQEDQFKAIHTMEYTFEILDDGNVILKSGRVVTED